MIDLDTFAPVNNSGNMKHWNGLLPTLLINLECLNYYCWYQHDSSRYATFWKSLWHIGQVVCLAARLSAGIDPLPADALESYVIDYSLWFISQIKKYILFENL